MSGEGWDACPVPNDLGSGERWKVRVKNLTTLDDVIALLDDRELPFVVSKKRLFCSTGPLSDEIREELAELGATVTQDRQMDPEGVSQPFGINDLVVDPFDNWGPSQVEIEVDQRVQREVREAFEGWTPPASITRAPVRVKFYDTSAPYDYEKAQWPDPKLLATILVSEAGCTIESQDGNQGEMLLGISVVDPHGRGRITSSTDPVRWAALIDTAFRSGYNSVSVEPIAPTRDVAPQELG